MANNVNPQITVDYNYKVSLDYNEYESYKDYIPIEPGLDLSYIYGFMICEPLNLFLIEFFGPLTIMINPCGKIINLGRVHIPFISCETDVDAIYTYNEEFTQYILYNIHGDEVKRYPANDEAIIGFKLQTSLL